MSTASRRAKKERRRIKRWRHAELLIRWWTNFGACLNADKMADMVRDIAETRKQIEELFLVKGLSLTELPTPSTATQVEIERRIDAINRRRLRMTQNRQP